MHNELSFGQIISQFEAAINWETKFKLLIQLANHLKRLDETYKTNDNLLHGCESPVWITINIENLTNKIIFQADSDSKIMRGILFLIQTYVREQDIKNLSNCNIKEIFKKLGLINNLSANRKTGIETIERMIKDFIIQLN